MVCFVIMFNRLSWPARMCEALAAAGLEVVLMDNRSTYPPLLEWYRGCPYEVHVMPENLGHKALYKSGLLDARGCSRYMLTDHDLDIANVPPDFPEVLSMGLDSNPWAVKSGLSLEIQDLPENSYTAEVKGWENNYWSRPRDHLGFYRSEVDTTLALYDRSREYTGFPGGDEFFRAVRAPRPYTARHLPWYVTPETIDEEERYYIENTNTYWSGKYKNHFTG